MFVDICKCIHNYEHIYTVHILYLTAGRENCKKINKKSLVDAKKFSKTVEGKL